MAKIEIDLSRAVTHDLIQKSGQFTLNIPPRPLLEQVKKIAETSGEEMDKCLMSFTRQIQTDRADDDQPDEQ